MFKMLLEIAHADAERSRARILKPGELTLAVYGADEALKWECRVLSFLQAVR